MLKPRRVVKIVTDVWKDRSGDISEDLNPQPDAFNNPRCHKESLMYLMCVGPCIFVVTEEYKNQLDATYYFFCTYYRLNMFRALLCPSSGARVCDVVYHISCVVLGLLYVGVRCS